MEYYLQKFHASFIRSAFYRIAPPDNIELRFKSQPISARISFLDPSSSARIASPVSLITSCQLSLAEKPLTTVFFVFFFCVVTHVRFDPVSFCPLGPSRAAPTGGSRFARTAGDDFTTPGSYNHRCCIHPHFQASSCRYRTVVGRSYFCYIFPSVPASAALRCFKPHSRPCCSTTERSRIPRNSSARTAAIALRCYACSSCEEAFFRETHAKRVSSLWLSHVRDRSQRKAKQK